MTVTMDTEPTHTFKLLEPSHLITGYDRNKPYYEQPRSIPSVFIDAMEVRNQVFVEEQAVPLANDFDSDDARSCHWVSPSFPQSHCIQ